MMRSIVVVAVSWVLVTSSVIAIVTAVIIREGSTTCRVAPTLAVTPPGKKKKKNDDDQDTSAGFFNTKRRVGRDVTVLSAAQYLIVQQRRSNNDGKKNNRPVRILDAMSASGIQGLRIAKEAPILAALRHQTTIIPSVQHQSFLLPEFEVVLNDMDPEAYNLIKANIASSSDKDNNDLSTLRASNRVAQSLLYDDEPYQFIVLDPFGSTTPHLDAALYNAPHGGRIELCATDVNVLYGSRPNMARRHYNTAVVSSTRRPPGYRERGIRLMLASVAQAAGRYDKGVRPLYCISTEHYCLVSVEILRRGVSDGGGGNVVDHTTQQVQPVTICSNCNAVATQTSSKDSSLPSSCCENPKDIDLVQGPLWVGPLFDAETVEEMAQLLDVLVEGNHLITGMSDGGSAECSSNSNDVDGNVFISRETAKLLQRLREEARVDHSTTGVKFTRRPDFASPQWTPKMDWVVKELTLAGFQASRTHLDPKAIRTNAAPDEFDRCVRDANQKTKHAKLS